LKIRRNNINPDFARFCKEPREDRAAVFTEVARQKRASPVAIEKDFYVCRTIDAIFHGLPFQPKPFFKGGTSLSKGHNLINRFSEDIDIILSAPGLGFSGAKDPANPEITKSMLKKVLSVEGPKALPQTLKRHTREKMSAALQELLPDCAVTAIDTVDPYGAALQVSYETSLGADAAVDAYISRSVLIETGARSAREPIDKRDLVAYSHEALDPGEWNLLTAGITLIKPERTMWDKIYILDRIVREHATGKLKLDGADRKSRHFYDLSSMFGTPIGDNALADHDLAERVRVAFRAAEDAVPGKLQLLPPDKVLARLRTDYDEGTSRMIFGDPPAFDEIVDRIKQLQAAINDKGMAKAA
jgi:Nucleotidyl transferase AbiEii toxin, Type IV TA system